MDKLKRLVSSASGDNVKQALIKSAPHPEQLQSSKVGNNEAKFSESDILAVQQRAETIQRAFNESLSIANQSKNRGVREYNLQVAREWLMELKKLANKFPFLCLTNLQAVEACIIAVEAETRSLPYGEVVDTRIKDVSDKARPESLALRSEGVESPVSGGQINNAQILQGFFRVINESIAIARKSKNLETRISRLRVARDRLKMAQEQASQFSLDVKGFDEAEAEINRIDEAIKTGTPTEISGMQQIDVNAAYSSDARNLLMGATALKKEKKYIEACDKLREAYSADGGENLFVEERLRLPMYLQLAGKNDEGWDELNRLYVRYPDQFSRPRIEHQMKIFLRKEKNETASNPVRVILQGDNKPLEATFNESRLKMLEANAEMRVASMIAANVSRLKTFEANADVVTKLEWISTLDGNTCPVCIARSGLQWDTVTKEPIGHSKPFENPPIHPNCRCAVVGRTRTFKEMGINIPEPKPGQRASADGPVPADMTFEQWLSRRTAAQQDEQLGVGRAQLWRDGIITLSQLIDDFGKELTLTELRAKYSDT